MSKLYRHATVVLTAKYYQSQFTRERTMNGLSYGKSAGTAGEITRLHSQMFAVAQSRVSPGRVCQPSQSREVSLDKIVMPDLPKTVASVIRRTPNKSPFDRKRHDCISDVFVDGRWKWTEGVRFASPLLMPSLRRCTPSRS